MAYSEVQTVGPGQYAITGVSFDPLEDLLWTGNEGGYVSSFYGSSTDRYSSFASFHVPVSGISAHPNGVLSFSNDTVRLHSRQGLCQMTVSNDCMEQLICLANSQQGSNVWLGGAQSSLVELDMEFGGVAAVKACTGNYTVLRCLQDRLLFAGTNSGQVAVHDVRTLDVVHSMSPHSGGSISDLDVVDNIMVTCGWSQRGHIERHLMVYDVRMFKPLAPYQLPIAPCVVQFVPAHGTSVLVLDQAGQFQICNPCGAPTSIEQYQISLEENVQCFTASLSSNSHFLAFGDTSGRVHIWGHSSEGSFNNFSQPCEMPNDRPELRSWDVNDHTVSLASVPMPWVNERLLSDLPSEMYKYHVRTDPPIDKDILDSMKVRGCVGYANNPRNRHRNQMPYKDDGQRTNGQKHSHHVTTDQSPMKRGVTEATKNIPKCYRPVKIRYSRFGQADFDFKSYNYTKFAGLEIDIPNAYCNSMLQVFYFLEPLKAAMQNHFCDLPLCLACELGFLFNMLDVSSEDPCLASNFLRAFRSLPEAQALGLLFKKDVDSSAHLGQLIQQWSRFVLQQLLNSTQPRMPPFVPNAGHPPRVPASIISRLFESTFLAIETCKSCGAEERKPYTTLQWSMTYPRPRVDEATKAGHPVPKSFSDVLCGSVMREQAIQSQCRKCFVQDSKKLTRVLREMPHVLCVNCQADGPAEQEFWKQQQELAIESLAANESARGPDEVRLQWTSWMPSALHVYHKGEDLCLEDASTLDGPQPDDTVQFATRGVYYDLLASVAHIVDGETAGALVSHINVSSRYHQKKENVNHSQWYIFNDFLIQPGSQDAAVDFQEDWKVPCILFYARRDLDSLYELSVSQRQDPNVLNISLPRTNPLLPQVVHPVRPLQLEELPKRQMLVGLDAEFVVLNQEEAELNIDGTKTTIKPSCLSLARITAVRGQERFQGVPFIDDYIATSEPVVDYLTKYSGIKHGDLDPAVSTKHLVTLKQAYRKLKFLIDQGVSFVGHGLKKDFRVINIVVPAEQVLDTAELFRLPNQRYVSLRFLAWFFLNQHIQSVVHDSAEDALTAVTLYRRYRDLRSRKQCAAAIKDLYEAGRKHNWQVPQNKVS